MKPGFKNTYKERSRPTPSIATNFINLKASFPSAFARWKYIYFIIEIKNYLTLRIN